MNNETTDTQSSTSGGYISFLVHLWVADNGKLIRGTIEDVHSGTQLALDLSEIIAFLQASLAHSPGQSTSEWERNNNSVQRSESPEERPFVDGLQDNHAQSPLNGDDGRND